jgi:hypothetical protein
MSIFDIASFNLLTCKYSINREKTERSDDGTTKGIPLQSNISLACWQLGKAISNQPHGKRKSSTK